MPHPYIGLTIVGEVTAYEVEIEGRGGDSVHDEIFETKEGAILASAIDGKNNTPRPVYLLKLSNGDFIRPPQYVPVRPEPTEGDTAKLLETLSPAVKLLLERKYGNK